MSTKKPSFKLLMSPRSPFARKTRIIIHEAGMAGEVEMSPVTVIPPVPNPDVIAHNPVGKIPVLLREGATPIYDSLVICEFIDSLNSGPPVVPRDSAGRIEALRLHALGDGMTEALVAWLAERFRKQPDESERRIGHIRAKVVSMLDAIEADEAGTLEAQPFHIGHAAIGNALDYADFRFAELDWRQGRPRAAQWHHAFQARPSVSATAYFDERKK